VILVQSGIDEPHRSQVRRIVMADDDDLPKPIGLVSPFFFKDGRVGYPSAEFIARVRKEGYVFVGLPERRPRDGKQVARDSDDDPEVRASEAGG
jgi:hypothetical protein